MIGTKKFWVVCVILLLTAALVVGLSRRGVPHVLQTNLEHIPLEILTFVGVDDSFSDEIYAELNADQHVYRHYRGPQGVTNLYIGYYGTAKGGRTGHNPYACLPASGWAIVERGVIRVETNYRPGGVDLSYLIASKDDQFNVMLHWYQTAGDKILTTGFQQNIQRFIGRVLSNRNDGAYVQVSALTTRSHLVETKDYLRDFAQEVLELLPDYWPLEG